jgi:hypothetical protein
MRLLFAILAATLATFSAEPQSAEDVSMVQLIATPEKFDGKIIQVIGFLRLEFEGDALYLHREDFDHMILRNAIWVEFPQGKDRDKLNGRYVFLQGTFRAKLHGHMDLFSGTLTDITRAFPAMDRHE